MAVAIYNLTTSLHACACVSMEKYKVALTLIKLHVKYHMCCM